MLTVQTMISTFEADVRNGSSQRRYQGNTAGAHTRDAAIGHANASGHDSGPALLSLAAVANPASNASPASNCGGASRSSAANTGPLKRQFCTYVPTEPIGIRPWLRNGRYSTPITADASAASRMRIRFQ